MKKILLVDDHADIRRLIKITLGNEFEILEAEDAVGALEIIHRERPIVVVMDIMMPGEIDGLDALQLIKADPSLAKIKVIMVTARGQDKDFKDGMDKGADAYFIKPFSPIQLVNTVIEFIRGQ